MRESINGINMAWDDNGSGPAICLIHGFPLNRFMWKPQLQVLTDAGYRVITPDLRGFGESGTSKNPCSMELFSDDLISLMDHLEVDEAVFAGMSMGGYVLMNLVERYRQRVTAACFIVTRSGADDEAGKDRRLKLSRDVMDNGSKAAADVFSKLLFAERTERERPELVKEICGWMLANDPRGLADGLLAMRDRKDYTPLLSLFRLPCLVIGAEDDRAISTDQARILADGLPDHTICLIPDAGHMVNIEQSEAFNHSLLDFLGKISAG
jgi:pimeloyl-ACP methyl ester carboxylesterase